MSVTIRLAKLGKKHAPAFKIVAANTRDKRSGEYLDVLGHYNPNLKGKTKDKTLELQIDKDKLASWKTKGALVTKAVESLVSGNYTYTPYIIKKATKNDATVGSEAKKEE